ncbi:MAG: nucleotidyl transferase AbiEii/AbiGii toxin family protein [Limisphaerales bacterium]
MNAFHAQAEMFRDALALTRQRTGFGERLIEKDYFCTVLLEYLASVSEELVFKGGSCLAKVHADFYRLSEDLDFVIPMAADAPRSQRSKKALPLKEALAALPERRPVFRLVEPLVGANNSTQYNAAVGYTSLASGREDTIKIEIGLREPLVLAVSNGPARTLLLDPVSRSALLKPLAVRCISKPEAFAEKFRAALSRREVAPRDFFDLDYAVRKLGLQPEDAELVQLVRQKLAVAGNAPVNVSEGRLGELRQKAEPQLRPVLRPRDFAEFDVPRAFRLVADMAAKVR